MVIDCDNLPDDASVLKPMVIQQFKTIEELKKRISKQSDQIAQLSEALIRMQNKFDLFFAKKSEKKKNPEPKEEVSQESKKRIKNGGGGRNGLPDSLPRIEQVIDVPEEERVCPICGKPFTPIDDERTELLVFVPMKLEVHVQIRKKYIAPCHCSEKRSVIAESPIRPIDKSYATTSLLAAIAVQKFDDHIPLARQITHLFRRMRVILPESSLCRWMQMISDLLEPLYDLMRKRILESFVIKADATTAPYREPGVRGRCKTGFVWGYVGDETAPYLVYDFQPNGTRIGLEIFLDRFAGYLQVDANAVYDQIFEPKEPEPGRKYPTEVGCWAHARRKFNDALKSDKEAQEAIDLIAKLYKVEKETHLAAPEERLARRLSDSVPVLDKIFAWCRERKDKYAPKELMFMAVQYALNHETVLRRYCDDGRLCIDNNEVERALRLAAIGRKNWLFFGSQRGGRTGAILYSILGSAKQHGLNEFEYLQDILDRLADLPSKKALFDLLPDRWSPAK